MVNIVPTNEWKAGIALSKGMIMLRTVDLNQVINDLAASKITKAELKFKATPPPRAIANAARRIKGSPSDDVQAGPAPKMKKLILNSIKMKSTVYVKPSCCKAGSIRDKSLFGKDLFSLSGMLNVADREYSQHEKERKLKYE